MKEPKEVRMGMIAVAAVTLVLVARRLIGTRRLSSGMMTLVVAGAVLLLVAAGGAGADTEITSCNFNADTDDEYYYLTDDIGCDANEIGVTIGANNVIIDGKGYNLHGSVASATCTGAESAPCVTHSGVVNDGGWDNVVVKDLEIENFCTGVVMGTSGVTVDGMTVTGCTIHDCGDSGSITHGIHLSGANNCIITENEVYNQKGTADMGDCGSGGNGIAMYGGSGGGHNTITSNYLHHNTKCGLHAKKGCMYNTISYNRATENAGAGIMPECKRSDYNTIEYNIMSDNVCGGFYTCGNHNTIRYNTANNNGVGVGGYGFEINAGIKMGSPYGTYNDVTDNTFCGNGGDDIHVTQDQYGWTNIIDKNTCDNANNATYCDWSCASEPDGAAPACVADDGTAFFCGDAVTKSCTFNGSMNCSSGAGLIIGANDITIDGVDFTITGNRGNISRYCMGETIPAEHSGIINTEYDNVTIKNLEIKDFCTGIALGTWPPVIDDNTITDCKIHDCGKSTATTHGIHLVGTNNCTITKNEVYNIDGEGIEGGCGGGGNGIFMYGVSAARGNHNTIACNNLFYNKKSGFFMKYQCMHNIISENTATGNAEGGIVLMCKKSNYNIIEGNNASENIWDGIYIGGRNNTIRNNSVFDNGFIGINMERSDGSYDNELYGNTVCGNGHADIETCGPECYGNHGDNNTCDSTSYYNDDGTTGCAYDCESEVGCVAEDGTVFRCGDTVTASCTFNGDMNCQARYGLTIGSDNITINGAGYALKRVDPGECTLCPSAGILNKGYDEVTITNLEIKHFCNGIYLNIDGGNVVYRNTVENCDIHHNGNATSPSATHGIKMRYVFDSTIRNNSIRDQIAYVDPNPGCEDGGNGLFLYQGEYNNITGNRFYNNQKAGMLIKMMPKYWNISHNHLWGNGQGGIILRCKLCDFNLIEYNNASDNYGSGIFIGGNDNTIRYNTVCNNMDGGPYYEDSIGGHGYGINIGRGDGSLDNTLISNTVCGNDHLDVRVVTGVTGNTGDENTCNTTYNYNDDGTTGCTYSCSTQQPLGDLNDDGVITPADAVIALQMAVRGEYSEDADVSGDHRVTSLDALLILQAAAWM